MKTPECSHGTGRLFLIAMAFLLFVAVSLRAAGTFDIYVIDVEHGNAVLAVSPTGESMLMDAGPPGPKYLERILASPPPQKNTTAPPPPP